MELLNFLLEVKLGEDDNINKLFNHSLELVFSKEYLNKINTFLKQKIKIIETSHKNPYVVAWNIGTTIYINKQVFYSKTKLDQLKYLLHEFFHVLMNKRSFIIVKRFKELHELANSLYKIVSKNLVKTIPEFLTGSKKVLPSSDEQEIISYLMNDKIDWSAITPEAKRLFIKQIEESKIFNLNSDFWKRRLY